MAPSKEGQTNWRADADGFAEAGLAGDAGLGSAAAHAADAPGSRAQTISDLSANTATAQGLPPIHRCAARRSTPLSNTSR